VSNWNFDIEDLKVGGERTSRGAALGALSALKLTRPVSSRCLQAEAGGDGKKDSSGSLAAIASSESAKVQHKGRFEVYDSDASASSEARARAVTRYSVLLVRCSSHGVVPLLRCRAPKCARGASWWRSLPMAIRCVSPALWYRLHVLRSDPSARCRAPRRTPQSLQS